MIVIEVSYSVSFERHDVSRDFIKKFPFIFKQYLYMSVHRQAARILDYTGKQKNQMYFYKYLYRNMENLDTHSHLLEENENKRV